LTQIYDILGIKKQKQLLIYFYAMDWVWIVLKFVESYRV